MPNGGEDEGRLTTPRGSDADGAVGLVGWDGGEG